MLRSQNVVKKRQEESQLKVVKLENIACPIFLNK